MALLGGHKTYLAGNTASFAGHKTTFRPNNRIKGISVHKAGMHTTSVGYNRSHATKAVGVASIAAVGGYAAYQHHQAKVAKQHLAHAQTFHQTRARIGAH